MTVVTERDGVRHRVATTEAADPRVGLTRCYLRVAMVGRPCDPSSVYQRATRHDCGEIVDCGTCFS